ncbi:hypothetical protein NEOC95_000608 [Neochlamydia sp. AcF95]|nr:hypothetical protein [Neochlamydia sp. AcF95]
MLKDFLHDRYSSFLNRGMLLPRRLEGLIDAMIDFTSSFYQKALQKF